MLSRVAEWLKARTAGGEARVRILEGAQKFFRKMVLRGRVEESEEWKSQLRGAKQFNGKEIKWKAGGKIIFLVFYFDPEMAPYVINLSVKFGSHLQNFLQFGSNLGVFPPQLVVN